MKRTENKILLGFIGLVLCAILIICFWGDSVNAAKVYPFETYASYASRSTIKRVRSSLILTGAYVSTDYLVTKGHTDLGVFIEVTKGSLTDIDFRFWFSFDGVDWFQEVSESVSAGTITVVPVKYTIDVSGLGATTRIYTIVPIRADYFKLDIKGQGTVTGSLCEINFVGRVQ